MIRNYIHVDKSSLLKKIHFRVGKFNFENLYISLLDQFQGASYGDHTFSRLVMAPLAQKHNIKWRHIVWSEHIHALRFVTCTENEVSNKKNPRNKIIFNIFHSFSVDW